MYHMLENMPNLRELILVADSKVQATEFTDMTQRLRTRSHPHLHTIRLHLPPHLHTEWRSKVRPAVPDDIAQQVHSIDATVSHEWDD